MSNNIPTPLKKIIGSEPTDFIFRTKRNYPLKKGLGQLIFAVIWNTITGIIAFSFIPSLRELTIEDFKGSFFDILFAFVPVIVVSIFVFVGVALFLNSLVKIFQKGAYFAITETRFIKYRNGKITVTEWGLFTGNITINVNGNSGDIEFQLNSGKNYHRENSPDEFVPDVINVVGVDNVYEIEKQCRLRIEQYKSL